MIPDQNEIANKLVEDFELLTLIGDPQEIKLTQYAHLLSLGKKLPPLDEKDKTEENFVHGCQSKVWIVADAREQDGQTVIEFVADSDAELVKGLITILRMVYSGQTPQNILSFDINDLLTRLDLEQHLRTGRRNGLDGMVRRIKTLASGQLSVAGGQSTDGAKSPN